MSQWCNECNKIPYDSDCNDKCPVFGLYFEELAKKHIEVINKLKYLKDRAETVDTYEDDIFADYRCMAESSMREIIDILLSLDLGEEKTI